LARFDCAEENDEVTNERSRQKQSFGARASMLIEGSELAIDAFIAGLYPSLLEPVCSLLPGEFVLPAATGTLVLRDVGALALVEQDALLRWMDELPRRVQVISATSTPLFPLVERGIFRAQLYYRLNIVHQHVPGE
jgi:transcriptional regulator of acetoin/glycerol metabolism